MEHFLPLTLTTPGASMVITSRIASGFDVELQLGAGWFLTAINLLDAHGSS